MFLTAAHLRAARALLDLKQSDVAKEANVSIPTRKRMESEAAGPQKANAGNVEAIANIYTKRGIDFLFAEGSDAVGVRQKNE